MDAIESFDGFDFDDHRTFNEQVDSVAAVEDVALVGERQASLSLEHQPAHDEFVRHASYADSSIPGPSSRWTSIAAPIIWSVIWSRAVAVAESVMRSTPAIRMSARTSLFTAGTGEAAASVGKFLPRF